jgi:hypothetical protein
MRVIQRGHRYSLDHVGGKEHSEIQFQNKEPGQECEGVTTQEILRVLIDRTHYCNNCLPHRVNEQIIWYFRMAIALHEARALEQKVAKGEIKPEFEPLGPDGHLLPVGRRAPRPLEETVLKPVAPLGTMHCDHRSHE